MASKLTDTQLCVKMLPASVSVPEFRLYFDRLCDLVVRVPGLFLFFLMKTLWSVVHKRTIQTERQPHVGEVSTNFLRIEGVAWSA
jgi:hypothetical protein